MLLESLRKALKVVPLKMPLVEFEAFVVFVGSDVFDYMSEDQLRQEYEEFKRHKEGQLYDCPECRTVYSKHLDRCPECKTERQ